MGPRWEHGDPHPGRPGPKPNLPYIKLRRRPSVHAHGLRDIFVCLSNSRYYRILHFAHAESRRSRLATLASRALTTWPSDTRVLTVSFKVAATQSHEICYPPTHPTSACCLSIDLELEANWVMHPLHGRFFSMRLACGLSGQPMAFPLCCALSLHV